LLKTCLFRNSSLSSHTCLIGASIVSNHFSVTRIAIQCEPKYCFLISTSRKTNESIAHTHVEKQLNIVHTSICNPCDYSYCGGFRYVDLIEVIPLPATTPILLPSDSSTSTTVFLQIITSSKSSPSC
jgi:hypothetical protein